MSKKYIKQLIQEKFGYTADMKTLTSKDGNPTAGKFPQTSAHPMEKFRNIIKMALGATTTEQDEKLENIIDFNSLFRLANKHGLAPVVINSFKEIQIELDKPKGKIDSEKIEQLWDDVKNRIPYWFLALVPHNKEEIEETDKNTIANLLQYMEYFNKKSEKAGNEASKDTEHASRDTKAKDNLNKARKNASMETEAASESKLKQKPEELEKIAKSKAPEVPINKENELDGEEYTKPNKDYIVGGKK